MYAFFKKQQELETVKNSNNPFNLCYRAIIWKIVAQSVTGGQVGNAEDLISSPAGWVPSGQLLSCADK